MKVLVLYQLHSANDRNTISEHLNSYRRYSDHHFHYYNVYKEIPKYLVNQKYDIIIFHYSFLAGGRFLEDPYVWNKKIKLADKLSGIKIAFPQDEYDRSDRLCKFFDDCGINIVYSCYPNNQGIDLAYRKNIDTNIEFKQTWTGFVDDKTKNNIFQDIKPLRDRKIDIGYRARKLPAYFGRHGQLKFELVNIFTEFLKDTDLVYDINNTNNHFNDEDKNQVKMGDSWLEFLLNCKAFIGCEGGSSLLDFDGDIKKKVLSYNEKFPDASFDEIEKNCFPGQDFNIEGYMLSPRHFECATTKTLQILVEGYYGNVFKPNIHYIELKRDFSNISEVVEKLKDVDYCQKIVDKAYEDIVQSGLYTYRKYVFDIFKQFEKNKYTKPDFKFKVLKNLLELRNWFVLNLNNINGVIIPVLVFKTYLTQKFHENAQKIKKIISS